jgi:hypothetical protein
MGEPKTPMERIVRHDHLATVFNTEKMLRDRKFLAELECGHAAYTGALKKAICPRCTEMLRRSLLGEADWDAYRHNHAPDRMIWREDPCRQFNEPTDLEGRFLND